LKVLVVRRMCLLFVVLIVSPLRLSHGLQQEEKLGVVVETVTNNLEADKAGVKPGDVILRWTKADAQGELTSPFDLSWVETELGPRGSVSLEGMRDGEKRTWTLGMTKWGIVTRPQMSDAVLLLYRQGQQLAETGKLAQAADGWKKAVGQAEGVAAIWFFYHVAGMWADARRWDEADKAYQEALETTPHAAALIRSFLLLSWADVCRGRGDWKKAVAYYQSVIAENQKLGAKNLTLASGLVGLGLAVRVHGDLSKAEGYLREALEIREKLAPNSFVVANAFFALGLVAEDRDDLPRAEEFFRRTLSMRQELVPGSLDVAWCLNELGFIALERGDPEEAEKYHLQALSIRQRLSPDSLDVAASLNNLGNVEQDRGDLTKASEYYIQSLHIKEELAPGSVGVANSLHNLGTIAYKRGDLVKAEEYYRAGLAIRGKLEPLSLDTAGSLGELGDLYRRRGDLIRAERYARQALVMRQKLAPGSINVAWSLNNLGSLEWTRGNLLKADRYYRQALALKRRLNPGSLDFAITLENVGLVAVGRGDLVTAEKYYREGLLIREKLAPDSLDLAETLQGLGEVAARRNDLVNAEAYMRQALALIEKFAPGSKDHAECLAVLGATLLRSGQSDAAGAYFAKALDAFEHQVDRLGGTTETRANFRADHSNYFSQYIDLLMQQNKVGAAFRVAERQRARTLLEMLAEAGVDIRQGVDPDLRSHERALQESLRAKADRRIRLFTTNHTEKQIVEVEAEIDDLRKEYQDVEARIRTTSPVYAALTQPQPLNAEEVQQLLDDNTVLLEYVLGEKRSYVWAITRKTVAGYEMARRSRVENLARRLHKLVSAPNFTTLSKSNAGPEDQSRSSAVAAALSRMVLGPVAAEIPGKRLVLVRDGALQYVPFAALPVPGKQGVPMIVEHEIVYAPSASVLAELRREAAGRKLAPKAVVVLADPVFDKDDPRVQTRGPRPNGHAMNSPNRSRPVPNERLTRSVADVGLAHLSRLVFSGREADAIMAVTPAGLSRKALGFEANRSTATSPELGQFRIVHFATHALSDSVHPELSGLVLSLVDRQGRPQDGFLDLQEIYNLNLPVELVVLSACQTGLGKDIKGEGMVGLTRGFMYAGATRVVASLWNADDVATKELMERFYKGMEQQGLTPAAALRQAQLSMWKQQRWKAPYYWAAFQLQGEWR